MWGIFLSACSICSSPSWYGLRGDRQQHTLNTWDWDCLSMWSREQWGSVGCSQAIFQRNSSLGDVNQMQTYKKCFGFLSSFLLQAVKPRLGKAPSSVSCCCASAVIPSVAKNKYSESLVCFMTGIPPTQSQPSAEWDNHCVCHILG